MSFILLRPRDAVYKPAANVAAVSCSSYGSNSCCAAAAPAAAAATLEQQQQQLLLLQNRKHAKPQFLFSGFPMLLGVEEFGDSSAS